MDLSSFVHVRRSGLLAAIISTNEINAIKMAEELQVLAQNSIHLFHIET